MTDATSSASSTRPTVLLVHGAFADSSGWNGVIADLLDAGIPVRAVPNPLRGVAADAAYVASAMQQVDGPVLAVGHSYGGAVITNAASKVHNVVGLVYVAAFAPEDGESLLDIEGNSKDSVLASSLVPLRYPTGQGDETATEFLINPEQFHSAFAADVTEQESALMAAEQRPAAEACFGEPTANPAWKSLPSWAVVPTGDKAAGSDVLRSMAERAGATIVESEGSHVIMVSQPKVITDVIRQALDQVG